MYLFLFFFLGIHPHEVPCAHPDMVRTCDQAGCTECRPRE